MKRVPGESTFTVVTEDASKALPIGDGLYFRAALVGQDFQKNAVWLQDWESFDCLLLMMQFGSSERTAVQGSAVLVAPASGRLQNQISCSFVNPLSLRVMN